MKIISIERFLGNYATGGAPFSQTFWENQTQNWEDIATNWN